MHTAIKEMLSTQNKPKLTGLTIFFEMCVWMALTMILPTPNFDVVDTVNQEYSAM